MQRPEHTDKTPEDGLFDGVDCDSRHGQNSMQAADPTTSPDASPHESYAPARRRLAGIRLGLVLFAAAGVFVATAGLAVQFRSDPYGVFHRREPDALVELDALDVERMLAGQLPAYEDYFHRVEIGSRIASTHAFGEHETFRPGMVVYVVARLIRNHPAMRLEGVLIAPDGQDVGRFEHDLDSSHSHAINGFRLTGNLPAGRYRILLQADGYRVAQKTFQLNSVPDDAADAAG